MQIGIYKKTSKKQLIIDYTIEDYFRELDIIHIYLIDMKSFFESKNQQIENELNKEDLLIKYSLLQQPNYKLYDKTFNDIVYKNIFVSLISKLEFNLFKLIEELENQDLISKTFVKKQPYIINANRYLNKMLEININIDKIIFFISIRNRIIHHNSSSNDHIKKNKHFEEFGKYVYIQNNIFYFKDLNYSLALIKEIRNYFNLINEQIQ